MASVRNSDLFDSITARLTPDMKSVLDVGCGTAESGEDLLALFPGWDIHGIDIWPDVIEWRLRHGPPGAYRTADAALANIPVTDVAVAHHVIEHMPKQGGLRLLERLEKHARKLVIVGAPHGWFGDNAHIAQATGNPFNRHVSTWTPDDLVSRGYEVEHFGRGCSNPCFLAFKIQCAN